MAIDTTEQLPPEYPGEEAAPQPPVSTRSEWLRPNILWALAGAVAGYLIGHWLGNVIASGYIQVANTGQNDVANVLALSFAVAGWLIGIGSVNYPLAKMLGREPPPAI